MLLCGGSLPTEHSIGQSADTLRLVDSRGPQRGIIERVGGGVGVWRAIADSVIGAHSRGVCAGAGRVLPAVCPVPVPAEQVGSGIRVRPGVCAGGRHAPPEAVGGVDVVARVQAGAPVGGGPAVVLGEGSAARIRYKEVACTGGRRGVRAVWQTPAPDFSPLLLGAALLRSLHPPTLLLLYIG